MGSTLGVDGIPKAVLGDKCRKDIKIGKSSMF
jgi:hypothetical protein